MTLGHDVLQLRQTGLVHLIHLGVDDERLVGVATEVLHRVAVCVASERCAVCSARTLVTAAVGLARSLSHHAFADDEGRLVLHLLGLVKGVTYLVHFVAVYLYHVPFQGAVFGGGVLVHHHGGLRGELYVVGVVEHDEVVKGEVAGYARRSHAYLFLHTTVADVGIYGLLAERGVASLGGEELGCYGGSHGVCVALAERTGTVLYSPCVAHLRMSRSGGAPLAELLKFFK